MESQPQNPEFRNNTENFHPCFYLLLSGCLTLKKKMKSIFSFSWIKVSIVILLFFKKNRLSKFVKQLWKIYRKVIYQYDLSMIFPWFSRFQLCANNCLTIWSTRKITFSMINELQHQKRSLQAYEPHHEKMCMFFLFLLHVNNKRRDRHIFVCVKLCCQHIFNFAKKKSMFRLIIRILNELFAYYCCLPITFVNNLDPGV